ncbi:MAG: hypothetical protein IIA87_01925 [Nanoarchaeota archaeon]|nr:hypothetical protein [Nanoarchaeota archaeon]
MTTQKVDFEQFPVPLQPVIKYAVEQHGAKRAYWLGRVGDYSRCSPDDAQIVDYRIIDSFLFLEDRKIPTVPGTILPAIPKDEWKPFLRLYLYLQESQETSSQGKRIDIQRGYECVRDMESFFGVKGASLDELLEQRGGYHSDEVRKYANRFKRCLLRGVKVNNDLIAILIE